MGGMNSGGEDSLVMFSWRFIPSGSAGRMVGRGRGRPWERGRLARLFPEPAHSFKALRSFTIKTGAFRDRGLGEQKKPARRRGDGGRGRPGWEDALPPVDGSARLRAGHSAFSPAPGPWEARPLFAERPGQPAAPASSRVQGPAVLDIRDKWGVVGAKNLSPCPPRERHPRHGVNPRHPHVSVGATGRSPLRRRVDLRGGGYHPR